MHDPYKYKTALWLLTLYGVNNPFFPFCFLVLILSVVIIKSSQVSFIVNLFGIGSESLCRAPFLFIRIEVSVQATVTEW